MVKELSKFDVLVHELECQILNDEEQLLLLAGTGNGVSLLGSDNCQCQSNNCQCQSNNCQCQSNNCQCEGNNCQCEAVPPEKPNYVFVCAL